MTIEFIEFNHFSSLILVEFFMSYEFSESNGTFFGTEEVYCFRLKRENIFWICDLTFKIAHLVILLSKKEHYDNALLSLKECKKYFYAL
jgi:hypothetical protein